MNFIRAAAAAVCVCASVAGPVLYAGEPKPNPVKEPEVKPEEKTVPADLYKLPDTQTVKALVEFCKNIENFDPKSQAELDEMKAKAGPALKTACAKIIELEKGDQTENGHYAKRIVLLLQLNEAGDPNTPVAKKALEELQAFLTEPNYTTEDVELAMQLGQMLEQVDPKKAGEFYTKLSAMYAKNADPKISNLGKKLAGIARRMNLVGSPMELKGTKLDGKPFDLAELKGKVILVDFWATWCHFCVEEIPNVKRNYEGYHAKGFEVVAISADNEADTVDDFVKKNKLPWINLHDKDGRNDAMDAYGIMGFPTTFLIGKDGKVLSLEARGEELTALLKKELGEPDPILELPKVAPAKPEPLKDAIKEAIKE